MRKFRKTILIFFTVIMLISALGSFAGAEGDSADGYLGDVNGDGAVTAIDARMILRYSANLGKIEPCYMHLADVDTNNKVTAADARIALRMSAKLESLFKFGETYHVHEYTVNSKPATCMEDGYEIKLCIICGYGEYKELNGSHQYKNATCTEPKTCSVCGITEGYTLGHNYVAPTCTQDGYCSRCGELSGDSKLNHKSDGYNTCIYCGAKLNNNTATQTTTQTQQPEYHNVVYRTKTGECYHYENPCGKGTYYQVSIEAAKAAGLRPCEKCVLH